MCAECPLQEMHSSLEGYYIMCMHDASPFYYLYKSYTSQSYVHQKDHVENMDKLFLAIFVYLSSMKSLNTHSSTGYNT